VGASGSEGGPAEPLTCRNGTSSIARSRADPDRDEARRRYADYLDQHGDELGEYIRLAREKARGALDSSRHARYLELDAKMDVRLGGALQGWVKSWRLDRGLVAQVKMDGAIFLAHGTAVFS
jgi:uncharacterized protein (TIGR02996 family)